MARKINKTQLDKGAKVELEHAETIKKYMKKGVSVKSVAREIARDHLKESPTYYTQLEKIEGKFKKNKQ